MAQRRTAIAARRHALASQDAPRFSWPQFVVTAPHGVATARGSEHARLPYGTRHARQVGSLQTACGVSAVTWQYFWTLAFEPADPAACAQCALAVQSP